MTKEQLREYKRRRHEEAKLAYNALMSCYPLAPEDLPSEQWRPIAGFDKYQISNFGRVKSFCYKKPRILKPNFISLYLSVRLYIDGAKKDFLAHVLVARAFIPNPQNKPEVNHDDGNKMNCHVSNLYWATTAENIQHAVRTGLKVNPQGEEHPRAKLTNEQAKYIRDNPDNLRTGVHKAEKVI